MPSAIRADFSLSAGVVCKNSLQIVDLRVSQRQTKRVGQAFPEFVPLGVNNRIAETAVVFALALVVKALVAFVRGHVVLVHASPPFAKWGRHAHGIGSPGVCR